MSSRKGYSTEVFVWVSKVILRDHVDEGLEVWLSSWDAFPACEKPSPSNP